MPIDPDRVREAVESGEPEAVNALVDSIEDLDRAGARAAFDDTFERCVGLYRGGELDGYRRQSVVRVLAAFVPPLGFPAADLASGAVEYRAPDSGDASRHRRRLVEFCLETIRDDDGRVRRATIRLLQPLSVGARLAGADAELEASVEALDALADDLSGDARDHVLEAREAVALQSRRP